MNCMSIDSFASMFATNAMLRNCVRIWPTSFRVALSGLSSGSVRLSCAVPKSSFAYIAAFAN